MTEEYEVEYYESDNGKSPYLEWENCLQRNERALITTRLARIRMGNFGDNKIIAGSKNLRELRIDFGPGYRIYYAKIKNRIVLLLCAGNKRTQKSDINKAKKYYKDYLSVDKR